VSHVLSTLSEAGFLPGYLSKMAGVNRGGPSRTWQVLQQTVRNRLMLGKAYLKLRQTADAEEWLEKAVATPTQVE
jgi:Tfp pilus assembly protein PilF